MSTTSARSRYISKKFGFGVGLVVFTSLLMPFTIIGENWGMVWMYAAAPLSFITEEQIGIRRDSFFLIAFISAGAATLWALIGYALTRLFFFVKTESS